MKRPAMVVGSAIKVGNSLITIHKPLHNSPACYTGLALTDPRGIPLSVPRPVLININRPENRMIVRSNDILGRFLLSTSLQECFAAPQD